MMELTLMQKIAVWALPVLFAITLHEVAHGWMASKLGDQSAKMLGRLSLNPLKHIDPIGTIIVPVTLLVLSGFVFGWAKAVPVNANNFKNPKTDMAWVAIAGPAANVLMVLGWAVVIKVGLLLHPVDAVSAQFLIYSGIAGVSINLILILLNLLPIPPLDGSRVLSAFLSRPIAWQYNRLEPYGFFILLGLMFTGVLELLLIPPMQLIQQNIYHFIGLM
jgi:Zn-dependent protease